MAETIPKEITFAFQEKVLNEHGDFLLKLFKETLASKKMRVSDTLYNNLKYEVTTDGQNRIFKLYYTDYGRSLESRYNLLKSEPKYNTFEANTNESLWGVKQNSFKPKNVNWYSKNAYGSLNRLIAILMYELTDEEVARLKQQIQSKITISL